MDKILREQLKNLKTNNVGLTPDPVWLQKTRIALVQRINVKKEKISVLDQVTVAGRIFFTKRFVAMFKPTMAAILVVFMSIAGWAATVSADFSIPGDMLYGVKLAKEKTQIVVAGITGQTEKKATLLVTAAKNRASETKSLVEQSKLDKVPEALNSLKESVTRANESLQNIVDENPEKAVDVAKQVADATGAIVGTLSDVTAMIASSTVSSTEGSLVAVGQINDAQKVMTDQAINAVEITVQNQNQNIDETTTTASSTIVSSTLSEGPIDSTIPASTTPILVTDLVDKNNTIAGAKKLAEGGQLSQAIEMAKQTLDVVPTPKEEVVAVSTTIPVVPVVTSSVISDKK